MNDIDIDEIAGPELSALIETEIFNALPLSDEEWDVCKAVYAMCNGPSTVANMMTVRLIKIPLKEPDYNTKLMFRLDSPHDYTSHRAGWTSYITDHMRKDGWLFDLSDYLVKDGASILCLAGFSKDTVRGEGVAETESLAIARAALRAIREYKKAMANTR